MSHRGHYPQELRERAIRLVRERAEGLSLGLPEPGQWGATLEAYLAETKVRRAYEAPPRAKAA